MESSSHGVRCPIWGWCLIMSYNCDILTFKTEFWRHETFASTTLLVMSFLKKFDQREKVVACIVQYHVLTRKSEIPYRDPFNYRDPFTCHVSIRKPSCQISQLSRRKTISFFQILIIISPHFGWFKWPKTEGIAWSQGYHLFRRSDCAWTKPTFRSNYGRWAQFSNQCKGLKGTKISRFEGPGQIQNADTTSKDPVFPGNVNSIILPVQTVHWIHLTTPGTNKEDCPKKLTGPCNKTITRLYASGFRDNKVNHNHWIQNALFTRANLLSPNQLWCKCIRFMFTQRQDEYKAVCKRVVSKDGDNKVNHHPWIQNALFTQANLLSPNQSQCKRVFLRTIGVSESATLQKPPSLQCTMTLSYTHIYTWCPAPCAA